QPAIAWSASGGGSINSAGVYTSSSSTGTRTITASSSGISGTTSIAVVGSPSITALPGTVTGNSTNLTAVGLGGLLYSYAWSVTAMPSGAATPGFSVNNSGSTTTSVTFYKAGTYTIE